MKITELRKNVGILKEKFRKQYFRNTRIINICTISTFVDKCLNYAQINGVRGHLCRMVVINGVRDKPNELARWLKCCKIDTVVMESTSVYWIPLFQILESEGFEVLLVNAKSVKNVPGRKSDVNDCQWLQQLHTYGLLSGSFQPENEIRELRTYLRQKNTLTRYASSHVQHIQKSLTLMNIQLHNVISDITGKSGMAVIREIVKGERDPEKLVEYCSDRLKNPKEVIKKSLIGNYTEDNIFILKQAIDLFDYYEEKILECDTQIQKLLKNFDSKEPDGKTTEENNISSKETKQRKKKLNPLKFKMKLYVLSVSI